MILTVETVDHLKIWAVHPGHLKLVDLLKAMAIPENNLVFDLEF